MIPVAFDTETSMNSASLLMDIAPWCCSTQSTCMWLRLTWPWTSRPIDAHRSSPTQPETSVRMASTEAGFPGTVAVPLLVDCSLIFRIS